MDKENIINRLHEHLAEAGKFYNKDRILGIFLCGPQNYGTATSADRINSKVIILPTFSDFCLISEKISKKVSLSNGDLIHIIDIRLYREALLKQNLTFLETLYTEYRIIDHNYLNLFYSYLIDNRESISHYNRERILFSVTSQINNILSQNPYDCINLYNAQRLYYFIDNYFKGFPYQECLQLTKDKREKLISIKIGNIVPTDIDKKALMEELKDNTQALMYKYIYNNTSANKATADIIYTAIIEILKASFKEVEVKESISKQDFMKTLTNTETKAYYSIIKEIGVEGNITISKLVEKNPISRPVYNNLIAKLKEKDIASVINMGTKGTYIKILNPELRADALEHS